MPPPSGRWLRVHRRRSGSLGPQTSYFSDGPEKAGTALVAGDVAGVHHPRDRRMHAAIGALRAQLEAAQAVDAVEAPGQVGGAQPGLAAGGAFGAEADIVGAHVRLSRRAMKKPSVPSRCGSV